MIVTIDGPAGSGKSTVARALAERLDMRFLDTGALYRAVTWLAMDHGLDLKDEQAVAALAQAHPPSFTEGSKGTRVEIAGRDVTKEIRRQKVSEAVVGVSQLTALRSYLCDLQRKLVAGKAYIAEGRDMGTVVFPNADLKFYLDADPEVRAGRRAKEMAAQGEDIPMAQLAAGMRNRDREDSGRKVAPLRKADDAEVVDTTRLSFEQVVDLLAKRIQSAHGK